ncbi:MAG: SDR family NAD(P)-dependent oxidoreductase [Saprospiraceae bacterium]
MQNRTALITGASSGIGLELAKCFAADGFRLILTARTESALRELATELSRQYGAQAHVIVKDLSDYRQAREIFEETERQGLQVDYLVNNAGFGDFGLFHQSDWDKQERMINLNITALTYLTRLYLPGMVARRFGRVMNVASTAAFQPGPFMSVYFATKAYVLHFTEAIANELEGTGVSATAFCPGPTESAFAAAAAMQDSKTFKGQKLPDARTVAQAGYKALMRGAGAVYIPGWANRLLVFSTRLAPRWVVAKIARRMLDK